MVSLYSTTMRLEREYLQVVLLAMGVKKCRQGYLTTIGKSWMAGWIVSPYLIR